MWSFARTAEAMFSRWAMKRVCKFLLKKKLGEFILGDIDLEQLDIQLGAGTIQLSDLALNTDFINQKFGQTCRLRLKEGSVGSVLIKLPWKDTGCQIELNELEVILTPCSGNSVHTRSEHCSYRVGESTVNSTKKTHADGQFEKHGSLDLHKGVEVILNVVKWFLSSFHITIKKVIVVFDPCLGDVKNNTSVPTVLVLRIPETECGTSVSENDDSSAIDGTVESFLGINGLTAFFQFQGAMLDLLHLEDLNTETHLSNASVPVYCESGSKQKPMPSRITVLAGEDGGLSGIFKAHVPWKEDSLDTTQVGTSFHSEPVKLNIRPKIINWLLSTFEILGRSNADNMNKDDYRATGSTYYNSQSHFYSPIPHSPVPTSDKISSREAGPRTDFSPYKSPEVIKMGFPSGSGVIADWVTFSSDQPKNEDLEDVDFTASIDEFFECVDGLRSYQSALGNSGMWGWTSSVFNAIRVTSSITSGYTCTPSEQQNIRATLTATVSKIFVIIALNDEETFCSCISNDVRRKPCSHGRFMSVTCSNASLSLKVSAKGTIAGASIAHIEASEHYRNIGNDCVHGVSSRILAQRLQKVTQALPQFVLFSDEHYSYREDSPEDIGSPCGDEDLIRVPIISASGTTSCHFTLYSGSSYCGSTKSTLFSLEIAPVILWVNINSISSLMDFLEEISCFNRKPVDVGEADDSVNSFVCDATKVPGENLRGSIFFPNARVIFCIPYNNGRQQCIGCCCCRSFFTEFITLNVSSPHTFPNKTHRHRIHSSHGRLKQEHCLTSSHSLQLYFGSIDLYLVLPTTGIDDDRSKNYRSHNVLSIANKPGAESLVTLIWQQCSTNGSWLVHKARELALTGNLPSRNEVFGKGREFTSVSTFKNSREPMFQVRKEIIYGSSLLVNAHFAPTVINLDCFLYNKFYSVLNELVDGFSSLPGCSSRSMQQRSISQMSLIVECDSIEICIHLDAENPAKSSTENSFPGSWRHFSAKVRKFESISVLNIGRIQDLNFFWVGHGDGELRGYLSGVPGRDFLLISCSNSTMGRGDGGGSNLSSHGVAGFDVIYIADPQNHEISSSVTVRGVTVTSMGDHLNWPDLIASFFATVSSESVVADGLYSQQRGSDGSIPIKTSFTLYFVDIGLSYEPYITESGLDTKKCVSCILAAASLSVSTVSISNFVGNDYTLRVHDVGILLSETSRRKSITGLYSTQHLKKMGYVKVGGGTFIEAVLRTNCANGLKWEFECSEVHSQIFFDTCDDSTACFISLLVELQQHFFPDMEELVPQLQARWDALHGKNERDVFKTRSSGNSFRFSRNVVPGTGSGWKNGAFGLMEERCEYSFHKDGCPSQVAQVSYQEGHDPKLIDEYCMPDFASSKLTPSHCTSRDDKPNGLNCSAEDVESNGCWYSIPTIMENHIQNYTEKYNLKNPAERDMHLGSCIEVVESQEMLGRVFFRNFSIRWRLYAGSHWGELGKGKGIDKTRCIELQLTGVDLEYGSFPVSQTRVSELSFCVHDVFILDKSKNAPWKLVLGYHESKEHPRDSCSKVFRLNLEVTRQHPFTTLEEYRLHVALLPLILHFHQTQLDFLINFFCWSMSSPPYEQTHSTIIEEALLPYFQKFDIWPFSLRIDYIPCHVDMGALGTGKYAEFLNLVPWKGIVQLKHVNGEGIFGWSNVLDTAYREWLEDIYQNQIYKLLQGFQPVRSVISVSSGAKKLVTFPVQSYQKDGRIVKGVQRGTIAFLRSISLEAVGLGVHLAAGAHGILLQAENIFTKTPPPSKSRKRPSLRSTQPIDAHQGMHQACETLVDGLGRSASALVQSPMKLYSRGGGVGSALASAVRSAPVAAIAPASAVAGALHCTLLGVRNSLDPEHRRETIEKYLGPTCYLDPK